MTIDTSKEAVEAMARRLATRRNIVLGPDSDCHDAAALLRALLAERDQLAIRYSETTRDYLQERGVRMTREKERDAAIRALGEKEPQT